MILYFTIISIFNLTVMALFLLLKKSTHKKANIFLGIGFLQIAYLQFQLLLFLTGKILHVTFLVNLDFVIFYLFGPAVYFYVLQITGNSVKWDYKKLLHLLPALPGIIFFISFKFKPESEIIRFINDPNDLFTESIINAWGFSSFLFYFVWSLFCIKKHQYIEKQRYTTNNAQVKWLYRLIILFIIVCIVMGPIVLFLNSDYYTEILGLTSVNIIFIFVFISIINQPEIISGFPNEKIEETPGIKYQNSLLPDEKLAAISNKLNNWILIEKPYLDSEITLKELAEQLSIPPHQLSQVINRVYGKSFFDLINMYRIEEAKKMLADSNTQKYTIEAIAYDCGFGSRASFNSIFKKLTGKSPSEFRKTV